MAHSVPAAAAVFLPPNVPASTAHPPTSRGMPRAAAFQQPARPAPGGALRGAAVAIGDVAAAVGIVLVIPFAILAVGLPVALVVRFSLWVAGLF